MAPTHELVHAAARGHGLLAAGFGSALILMPLLNGNFQPAHVWLDRLTKP